MNYSLLFFKKYAEDHNLGPTEMGKLMGVTKQSASCYMSGDIIPRSDTLWRIAERLGISDMNVFSEKGEGCAKKGNKRRTDAGSVKKG